MAVAAGNRTVVRLVQAGILTVWMTAASPAAADATAKAAADELFRQAVELAGRGDYEAASSRFKASYDADPTLGTLLGLAMAEQRCGKLASAYVHYQELLDLSRRFQDAEREREAIARMEALEPQVPRLTLRAAAPLPRGGRVLLDASPLPVEALGSALPVDPGDHLVVVRDGERELFSATVRAAPGSRDTVVARWATASPVALQSGPAERGQRSSPMRTTGAVVAGSGVLLSAAGAYLWFRSDRTYSDVSQRCPGEACTASDLDRIDGGRSQEGWGRLCMIAGGVAMAAGVVVWAWGGGKEKRESSVRVGVGPGNLRLTGAF